MKTTQEIWNENTITEQTEDHWGVKGKGTPLVYFNPEAKNIQWIEVDKIKEAIRKSEWVVSEGEFIYKDKIFKELFGGDEE